LASAVKLFNDEKVFGVTFHEKGIGYAKGLFSEGYIQQMGEVEYLENQFGKNWVG